MDAVAEGARAGFVCGPRGTVGSHRSSVGASSVAVAANTKPARRHFNAGLVATVIINKAA